MKTNNNPIVFQKIRNKHFHINYVWQQRTLTILGSVYAAAGLLFLLGTFLTSLIFNPSFENEVAYA